MSNEILTIDTSAGVITQKEVEPLSVLNEYASSLDQACEEYDVSLLPNAEMEELASRLKMTMRLYAGLGLSANQCGVMKRMFVVGSGDTFLVCINPKIVAASNKLVNDNEGCLSYPALYLKIPRPEWIDVEYYDQYGKFYQVRLTGLTARCFAHELDHLNGRRFTAYVGKVSIQMARKRQEKIFKRYVRNKKK